VSGGTFANGQTTSSFSLNQRPAPVTVGDSGALSVTYTVTCAGENGDRTSPASPEAAATIQTAPSPNPSQNGNGGGNGGGSGNGGGNGSGSDD